MTTKCFGPLFKQCVLTSGVSINFMTHGMVMGFSSVLLPQLRATTDVDESTATWIASIFGVSLILGTLSVPLIMSTYGRKPANIVSATLMTVGWLIISASERASTLLLARFLQGFSMGFLADMGNIFIGECCSPKNRGAFLTTISVSLMLGTFLVHSLGTVISSWQTIALISACISFLDLIIIVLSPESPSFYAMKGKYDECRKAFRWLRGQFEEDELEKLIKINMTKESNITSESDENFINKLQKKFVYLKTTLKKKEVYKPIVIMLHLYVLGQWCIAVTFDTYAKDILDIILGTDINFGIVIVSLDLQRLVSNFLAILAIKMIRRKLVLVVTMSTNVICYFSIALYVYLKTHDILSYDHPFIGLVLLHIHLFTTAVGAVPLINIIAGEIYPLQHRGLCGMIGILFFSINETINMKSARYLFASIGLHGAYTIYGLLVAYSVIVVWILLPETKDRVLLDIEEEFRGSPLIVESKLIGEDNENVRD
ncbi:hypothetical protein ABMA27_012513 [Loxostege sticticalis]|uniref:Major facilitator superfamily (MFS) profile domain-containing protein n=1 Tax=Loxostege sticticalis TaxID=481309 RepID=A0ABR3GYU7_LOXSC